MEDDAGKLTHVAQGLSDNVQNAADGNCFRPEIHSEKRQYYAKEIQKILRYSSSDADMEKGMMRFDINVSFERWCEGVRDKNSGKFEFIFDL